MKKTVALLAAVMSMSVITSAGFPVSARYHSDFNNLPYPLSADKNDKMVMTFRRSKPKLTISDTYKSDYYDHRSSLRTLEWNEIDGALLYYVYAKKGGSGKFEKIGATLDTYMEVSYTGTTSFYVRAISFDTGDNKIKSRASNVVKVNSHPERKKDPEGYYYDYDYEEEDDCVYMEEAFEGDAYIPDEAEEPEYVSAPAVSADTRSPVNTEEYSHSTESGVKLTADEPVSVFSADVDTASYTNIRRKINDGSRIPSDAVRIEEMLNYFDYGYTLPKEEPFGIYSEISDCPWNENSKLMMVGVQAKETDYEPDTNLVFLIDVSGSMYSNDKLPLVKESINMLMEELDENDRISIVTYSGEERIVLTGANGCQKNTVAELLDCMEASGCTNGESGINMAYEMAENNFIEGGNNRIVMATDGDLNVGIQSEDALKRLIEKKRESGVYFTVLGYGTGNIKDNKMETLADSGNGSYHYIDCAEEAERVLIRENTQTLYTVAEDVKIQVTFNKNAVKSYRLIGYDNRRLKKEDFENDAKDAGEVGAGQSVTALYEIVLENGSDKAKPKTPSSICTVNIRYKDTGSSTSKLISDKADSTRVRTYMSSRMKLAAAAAEFGLYLKNSPYKGSASPEDALRLVSESFTSGSPALKNSAAELRELIEKYLG